ncbi:MAG: NAD-dependent epimerase/dehydratase family protein [Thermoanaerobaculales bacterium]
MIEVAGARWRELAPEIGREELAAWAARIMQPVAMTGATGFVGSHLVDALLAAGIRPRALVRDPAKLGERARRVVEVVRGDLDDRDALRRVTAGAGTVLHLAGVVRAASAGQFDRGNRAGTENLVAAVAEASRGARLVAVSSLSATGPSKDPSGRAPEDKPQPISAYGRSKLGAENSVRTFTGPWVILRPPAIFGPRDTDVLQFFRLAARGAVPVPAGERWLSTAYVADVVRAILAAAAGEGTGRILHLGEPAPREIRDLIRLIATSGGVHARVVPVPRLLVRLGGVCGDMLQRFGVASFALTSDKARELVGRHWTAQTAASLQVLGLEGFVPFATGAGVAWAWYREHGWVPRAKMHEQ